MLFVLPLILILTAWGQATRTLSGTVLNAEGASVANAAVTVTPANGGSPQKALTDKDGKFTITGLPEGAYKVEVEYSGYKRSAVESIDLGPSAAADIRVALQRGDARETVRGTGARRARSN